MNGSVICYVLALAHACAIWFCFLCYTLHSLDGDIVTLQGGTLVVESIRGRRRTTYRFNAQWAVLSVTQTGAQTRLSLRCAGESLELGRFATQTRRLEFLAEFQRISRGEMVMSAR